MYCSPVRQRVLLHLNLVNRPGFPGECFICELRLPDHRFRWKHNKLFLLL
ncbi:integrase, partial [Escherichia coli]|nr:integrase [Escherichia coli]